MEWWFYLAIASAVSGGVGGFIMKIAAMRNYNVTVLSVHASVVSAAILLTCTAIYADFSNLLHISTLIAFVGSVIYLVTTILKVDSLRDIDSAIFFPIYKVAGPALTIFLGIIIFSESFTQAEWIGLVLSLCVPLMLITRSEHTRQKNLTRGVYVLLVAAVLAAISIALFKYGTDITPNVWLYLAVADVFIVISAVALLVQKYRSNALTMVKGESTPAALRVALVMGVFQAISAATIIFAFSEGGPLGIVYTINSLYILIPIVLSIIFYNEHWNAQKAVAIVLSIFALALLK